MRSFALLLLSALTLLSYAQEFTLEDAIIGRWTKFRTKSPNQLQWIPESEEYSFVNQDTANPTLVKSSLDTENETSIVSLEDLEKVDFLGELKRFPKISWTSPTTFRFKHKKDMVGYDTKLGEARVLFAFPEAAENMDIANDQVMAYTRNNNLYVFNQGEELAVTSDEDKAIVNGQAVHRYEFGIYKGTFWSNQKNKLAFYRKDETMVSDYPLANYTTKPASSNLIKYPMAGMPSHHVTVGVYDLESKQTVWLKTGEPKEQYLTNIAWSPDDKFIYVAVLNRDQNHVKLNQYDASSGDLMKTLFEEKHEKYVQPLHPMEFFPQGKYDNHFIWQSERDGFNNLYLYNAKGKLVKQLTKGKDVVTSLDKLTQDGTVIYTIASNNGLDRTVYKTSVENDDQKAIAAESGVHRVKINDMGTAMIESFSNSTTPPQYSIRGITDPKQRRDILENDNPYQDVPFSLPELGTLKAEDGSILNYRMIKPSDFDASKKYKCLVYVYQGPGVQLITNSWLTGAAGWMQYMANKGYVVFTLDGRGTENRGRDFEQVTFRKLGEVEMVDQLKGVEFLRSLPYIDGEKMAVHGWSYGGFMTTSLMLRAPGIFQVGVAGGPVIDWKYYEVMYTERFMDTPESNPAGYASASLLDKVDQLKGNLLIIHGADDDVVVPQHSIDFLKNSVDNGVQVDFFLYPGHKHNVRGKDRVHLMRKVLDYIDEKLGD